MLNALKSRLDARKHQAEQRDTQEQERLKRMERIVEQAGKMEDLLEDARYSDYKQLLIEARESLITQLVNLDHNERDAAAYAHDTAFIQGRIFQLDGILTTPETFMRLAEESHTTNGAGRPVAPTGTARHATSARI